MITFTPLSVPYASAQPQQGTASSSREPLLPAGSAAVVSSEEQGEIEVPKALSYLLQLDDLKILIDCGSTEDFSFIKQQHSGPKGKGKQSKDGAADWEGQLSEEELRGAPLDTILSKLAPSLDLVLLSHSTMAHLGSLAWVKSHYGLTCPIYATLPTQAMGRLTVLEMAQCLRDASDVDLEMKMAAEIDSGEQQGEGDAEMEAGPPQTPIAPTTPRTPGIQRPVDEATSGEGGTAANEEVDEAQAKASADRALKQHLDPTGSQLSALRERVRESNLRRRVPTVEQVEETFESISTLRYLQPYHFSHGRLGGITVTAYNAGHTLGGAIWKLRSPSQGTILIALDWNHNRERHLDGTALLGAPGGGASSGAPGGGGGGGSSEAVRRADLLISSVERGLVANIRRKDRDAAIIDLVHKTLQSNASVLFPIDPSARLLELLVLLDQHWAYAYRHVRFPLCLVSHTGSEVIERARALLEWMTREWATAAAAAANNPAAGDGAEADDDKNAADRRRDPRAKRNDDRRTRDRMQKEATASPLDFK